MVGGPPGAGLPANPYLTSYRGSHTRLSPITRPAGQAPTHPDVSANNHSPTITPVAGAPQGSFVHLRLGSRCSRWLSPTALPWVVVIRLSATDNSLEQGRHVWCRAHSCQHQAWPKASTQHMLTDWLSARSLLESADWGPESFHDSLWASVTWPSVTSLASSPSNHLFIPSASATGLLAVPQKCQEFSWVS